MFSYIIYDSGRWGPWCSELGGQSEVLSSYRSDVLGFFFLIFFFTTAYRPEEEKRSEDRGEGGVGGGGRRGRRQGECRPNWNP